MIYSITGVVVNLLQLENCYCVAVECDSGVCFSLKISSFAAKKCGVLGEKVRLFAHLVVRENLFELFGFFSEIEKTMFKMLVSVSGVGPSFAISILSNMSVENLAQAIVGGNEKAICCCKGIGKKTATRIVLELKSKVEKLNLVGSNSNSNLNESQILSGNGETNEKFDEAVKALMVLGYDKTRAEKVVYSQSNDLSIQQLIKGALKELSN